MSSPERQRRPQLQRSQGFADEVFEIIRADIMSLRIEPGSRISIDNLARELGVSQTPIREALSMLEAIGLVTKQRFVGYCCAPQLDRKQLDELYEARLVIEPYMARAAADRMGDREIKAIRKLADQMVPGSTRTSYDRFARQDADLHDLIAAGCGNSILQDALASLHAHFHIFRLRFHSEVTTEAYVEHGRLVDALSQRDAVEAEAAMRGHLEKSYSRMLPFAAS